MQAIKRNALAGDDIAGYLRVIEGVIRERIAN
jgi:hypothetical protein